MRLLYGGSANADGGGEGVSQVLTIAPKKQTLMSYQPQNIPIWQTLIQYGSLKRKIVAVAFFSHKTSPQVFFLKFNPTSTSQIPVRTREASEFLNIRM